MFNKLLSKAVSKELYRYNLNYIKYDKEEQCYVATNGHILMIEYTDDKFNTDKFFSPRTGLEEYPDITFPEWKRLISENGEEIVDREFSVLIRKEKSKRKQVNKVVKVQNLFFNFEYMYDILKFIGNDFSLITNGTLLKFESNDHKKVALIMNFRMEEEDFKESEVLNTTLEIKNVEKKAKYVYLAYDENGNVKGVFNKEKDANGETVGIVKCFPVL